MTMLVTKYDDPSPQGQPFQPEHQQSFAAQPPPPAQQYGPPLMDQDSPPQYDANLPTEKHAPTTARRPTFGERLHRISSRAGPSVNRASNLIGAEGWWPSSLEHESLKAARILYSFANFDVTTPPSNVGGPKHPTGLTRKKIVKIPVQVLRNCAGLAIFNNIRAGAWHGGLSGGSGLVVARHSDGTWSPPSSFVVSSLGAGFMLGLDVYDCVCVLNTPDQVDAFTKPHFALGGGAGVTAGPVGGGASVAAAVSRTCKPTWTYTKSRGLWAGVSIEGTVVVTRNEANSLFYQENNIAAQRILRGEVPWPMAAKPLFEILKAIEGRRDVDYSAVEQVASMPAPGDAGVEPPANHVDVGADVAGEKRSMNHEKQSHKGDDLYESSVIDEKEALAKAGV